MSVGAFVGAGSLIAMHRLMDQQVPPNSKIHNGLRRLNPPSPFLGNSADHHFCKGGSLIPMQRLMDQQVLPNSTARRVLWRVENCSDGKAAPELPLCSH